MTMTQETALAICCGDPAGIGPEVIERWWRESPAEREGVTLIGPAGWLERFPGAAGIQVGAEGGRFSPGAPSEEGAALAIAAMETAARLCREGTHQGVVSGPVSKQWLRRAGFRHPGQTEYFAEQWGGEPTMGFCGGRLRVVLATWHLPLREVVEALTPARLARAVEQADFLARAEGAGTPRIGVCGLNPHAGEGGMLGSEEADLYNPVLSGLRDRFPALSDCQPADTLFFRMLRGEFDVVVALYHDQGLGPLKTLEFDQAVNVTLGLPFVRTSPDHGTAFALAGRGTASWRSLAQAVGVARRMAHYRKARAAGA